MIQHPAIAAALGQQRHAAFLADAERARLAREARATRRGRLSGIPATRSRLARLRPARAR